MLVGYAVCVQLNLVVFCHVGCAHSPSLLCTTESLLLTTQKVALLTFNGDSCATSTMDDGSNLPLAGFSLRARSNELDDKYKQMVQMASFLSQVHKESVTSILSALIQPDSKLTSAWTSLTLPTGYLCIFLPDVRFSVDGCWVTVHWRYCAQSADDNTSTWDDTTQQLPWQCLPQASTETIERVFVFMLDPVDKHVCVTEHIEDNPLCECGICSHPQILGADNLIEVDLTLPRSEPTDSTQPSKSTVVGVTLSQY